MGKTSSSIESSLRPVSSGETNCRLGARWGCVGCSGCTFSPVTFGRAASLGLVVVVVALVSGAVGFIIF